jgi:hypothetical protein
MRQSSPPSHDAEDMRPPHDLIAFYRHVLRSGDIGLARRLGRTLMMDPRYRARALTEWRRLPRSETGHSTAGGLLLDELMDRVDPLVGD